MKTAELAALQAAHFHTILGDRSPPAVRRSVEDIRREHGRVWRSGDQHWQDIAVLLDEIAELQVEIDSWDLAEAEAGDSALASEQPL